jgi:peroxiredoxin
MRGFTQGLIPLLGLAGIALAARAEEARFPVLALNAEMPAFELPGVDGKIHRSTDWETSKVLVVIFTCNHCPTAQLYEGRIKALAAECEPRGITVVAIQPNNPQAIRLDELGYTDVSDSFDEMKIRAAYRHFNFPYLYDGDTQQVAKAFGPSATPHAFVFDSRRRLRYEGRIDNSVRENLVTRHDLREAINAVLLGRPVIVPRTPSIGCSTKWAYKEADRKAEEERLAQEPVSVTEIQAADLEKVRQNPGGKITLVSFWATWCGPCVDEMPALRKTWEMYRHRPFNFVTVSVNYPDERKGVMRVLEEQHMSGRNLLFGAKDTYGLMRVFDPDWDASVPYNAIVGIDGSIAAKLQGTFDILTLRRRILANLPDDDYVGQRAYWSNAPK